MKHTAVILGLTALIGFNARVFADDAVQSKKPTATQTMKECMEKQRAANSGMTQAAMETVCKNEAKGNAQKDGNDLATAPKADAPGSNPPSK